MRKHPAEQIKQRPRRAWAEEKIEEATRMTRQKAEAEFATAKNLMEAEIESLRKFQRNQESQSKDNADQAREVAIKQAQDSHQKAGLLARVFHRALLNPRTAG